MEIILKNIRLQAKELLRLKLLYVLNLDISQIDISKILKDVYEDLCIVNPDYLEELEELDMYELFVEMIGGVK